MDNNEGNKNHVIINIFIFIVILLIALYLYARYVEHSKIITKEYRISSEILPQNFDGIKIVHISDIYFGNTTDIKEIDKLVNAINVYDPDLILFTGNLYGNNIKKESDLQKSLLMLKSKLGKYAVKGNNDYYDSYTDFMEGIDFKVLDNNYDLIYKDTVEAIYICGLSSSLKEEITFDNCDKYFEDNPEVDNYSIYMVHESDVIKKITDNEDANLILTGNSLGGYIKIPFYGSLIRPHGSKKYLNEYYKIGGSEAFVSSGIGTDKYPYRFLNKPSFNLYRLKSLK